jgi:hypothetical protein
MEYVTPVIVDYGDITELTRASGMAGVEDGAGKAIAIGDGLISVAVVP